MEPDLLVSKPSGFMGDRQPMLEAARLMDTSSGSPSPGFVPGTSLLPVEATSPSWDTLALGPLEGPS